MNQKMRMLIVIATATAFALPAEATNWQPILNNDDALMDLSSIHPVNGYARVWIKFTSDNKKLLMEFDCTQHRARIIAFDPELYRRDGPGRWIYPSPDSTGYQRQEVVCFFCSGEAGYSCDYRYMEK